MADTAHRLTDEKLEEMESGCLHGSRKTPRPCGRRYLSRTKLLFLNGSSRIVRTRIAQVIKSRITGKLGYLILIITYGNQLYMAGQN